MGGWVASYLPAAPAALLAAALLFRKRTSSIHTASHATPPCVLVVQRMAADMLWSDPSSEPGVQLGARPGDVGACGGRERCGCVVWWLPSRGGTQLGCVQWALVCAAGVCCYCIQEQQLLRKITGLTVAGDASLNAVVQ